MTTETNATKPTNYSAAQEAILAAAIVANGNVANKTVAETLAADKRMNVDGEPRKVRSIIAKMRRMVEANDDFSYEKVAPVSKTGKAVAKKSDIVAEIARRAGIQASKLEGLAEAPKLALETLRDSLAA